MVNLEEIKRDVKRVIEYSQDIPNAKVDNIINDWYEAKSEWIHLMKDNLIYEYPEEVKFELDKHAQKQLLESFIEKVENYYCNYELSCFLNDISSNEFFENLTNYDYTYEGNIKVPKKYKVVKAFKFFVSNEEKLKDIQNEASMIIQQNVVSGKLCFSVHPLDYLSLSENVHNWRSCHALDGDYRSGNMNYMMDENTVICYLRAEKQAILPHFPEDVIWNSKKWRVLLFMSEDKRMIFMGRQYPFSSKIGINMIKDNILPKLIYGSKWTTFHEPINIPKVFDHYANEEFQTGIRQGIPLDNGIVPISFLVKDGENTHQFNDLLKSSCYIPVYSYRDNPFGYNGDTRIERTKFLVGKKCRCPQCGVGYIDFGEKMFCSECDREENIDDYFECGICGVTTHRGYEYTLPYADMSVCPDCFTKYTHACEECGIRDIDTYVHYHPEYDNKILCDSCADRLRRKAILTEARRIEF